MDVKSLKVFGQKSFLNHGIIIPKETLYRKVFLLHTQFTMFEASATDLFCQWLENYLNYERLPKKDAFSLDTMRFLVKRFQDPQNTFRSVHVAGSKGKGSVSAMTAAIFSAAGKKTGLYTSPHMIDFTERVATPHGPFSDALYAQSANIVMPLVESMVPGVRGCPAEPTWFELVTLFAFVTFRQSQLDWAVVETGLGGRLDATNVLQPEAAVITPIELEHTEYLGDTLEKIASEKAGIIKPGVPVFSACQKSESDAVLRAVARQRDAPFYGMQDAVQSVETRPSFSGLETEIRFNKVPGGPVFSRPLRTTLRLLNSVQGWNAALAAYTAKYLMPELTEEVIEQALSRAWLPGRFEIVAGSSPAIVLDGAHTGSSIAYTVRTFTTLVKERSHLLFACASDKEVETIAPLFGQGFEHITLTIPGLKKSSDLGRLENAFRKVFELRSDVQLQICRDYHAAITDAIARAAREQRVLLVTGSFYLVAEVKQLLEPR